MKRYGFNDNWYVYPVGQQKDGKMVRLPHDAMREEQRIPNLIEGAASGYFPGGKYVYEKKFIPEESWREQTVMLEFEGVYQKSEIYLNEKKIGGWIYGYTGFTVNLTEYLIFDGENKLRVIADNSQTPNARWYTGSGIYRPVFLLLGGKCHILPDGIRVTTRTYEPAVIDIDIQTSDDRNSSDKVFFEIYYQEQIVAKGTGLHATIEIPDARLWSAECPELYKIEVHIGNEDEASLTFGIRKIEWDSVKGLRCNGKTIKLKGACIHHDNGPLGACEFMDAAYRRVRLLKEVGYNAIRSAHNPISKELLQACDELGMYVKDETFDMWLVSKNDYDYSLYFEQEWKKDITAMVAKDYNHPSVILYSIGNEITDIGRRYAEKQQQEMVNLLHELDSNRPVTNAINIMSAMSKPTDKKKPAHKRTPADVVDPKRSGSFRSMMGSKLINNIVTIFPALIASIKADKVDANLKAYMESEDIVGYNYGDLIMENLHHRNPGYLLLNTETFPKSIGKNWPLIEKENCYIGDFMWTGWDYLGEVGIGVVTYGNTKKQFNKPYPCISAGIGSINLIGDLEGQAYYSAAVFHALQNPYIGVHPVDHYGEKVEMGQWRGTDVFACWDWPGYEGKMAAIDIFSDCAEVELLQDGRSIGRKKTVYSMASFETIYQPGKLEAIAYDRLGEVIGQRELLSSGTKSLLIIRPEKESYISGKDELIYVWFQLQDEKGTVKMQERHSLSVKVTGVADLFAVGNGNPMTEESFCGMQIGLYHGKALAILRLKGKPGEVQVTVHVENLGNFERTILVC